METRPAAFVSPSSDPEGWQQHCVICGLGRFGLRIVDLLRQSGQTVVVITDTRTRPDRIQSAEKVGATVLAGDFRFSEARVRAGVDQARCVIFATASGSINLEAALDIRRHAPQVRLVMRLDSYRMADRLSRDFGIDAVLSPPVLAAPEFVRAALEPPRSGANTSAREHRASRSENAGSFIRRFAYLLPRQAFPQFIFLALMALFATGVAIFHHALSLSIVDAIYFTSAVITTVGFGDINLLDEPPLLKLFGSLMMFSGIVLIAVLASFLTNWFLSGQASQQRSERIARSYRGHVILCGLGDVGSEIAADLIAADVRVVVVDATPGDTLWAKLSPRIPLLQGDATQPEMLLRAGLKRARAVIAATSDDAINLEIGLAAQTLVEEFRPNRPIRLVMRCFDPDLAHRIHAVSDVYTLLSAAEIAAPIFVQRALETPSLEAPPLETMSPEPLSSKISA